MKQALHDMWCAVTRRCRVSAHDDPMLEELQAHERDAWRAAEQSRRRQARTAATLAGMASDVQRHWAQREDGDHVG